MSDKIFSALAILLLSFIAFGIGNIMISDSTSPRTLSLESVEGSVRAKPDSVEIFIDIEGKTDQNMSVSTDKMNQISASIITNLKQIGLTDENIIFGNIRTNEYRINESKFNESGEQIADFRTAFVATQSLSIRIKTDKFDKVPQVAKFLASIDSVHIASFDTKFENIDNIHKEARKIALQNAKSQAENMASELGIRLGKVIFVSEWDAHHPARFLENTASEWVSSDDYSPILSEQDYRVKVSIQYEIR